jgi:dienelactone hydrolase
VTWKRRLALGGVGLFALIVVGSGVLWFLKPWVPDIPFTDPGPTGKRIVKSGLFANYFPSKAAGRGPAVMMLGGSGGGIGDARAAIDMQSKGFSVLMPSYFGAPGQRGNLERIRLETFDRALVWLRSQPQVDPHRMAVIGHSKGAEAALLVGVRHPELGAVVAVAPSSYVWPGISWNSLWADSSWTSNGRPLPALPYGPLHFKTLLGDIGRLYSEGLEKRARHPDAAIPVERIEAHVLLVCGEADALWPSCPMARQLKARAGKAGDTVRVLAYAGAGHRVFGPPVRLEEGFHARFAGGTPAADTAARTDGWPKVIDFLRRHLARTE